MTKVSCVFLIMALLSWSDISDIQIGTCQDIDQLLSQNGNQSMINNKGVFCGVCKSVVKKVMATIGKHISKDETGQKLDNICAKLKIPFCKRFVRKYRAKLIDALSAGGDGHSTCVKLKLCKRVYNYKKPVIIS
ncbi:antimicrobial peptide NK-lysin-like [Triplophysa dalaica]|uniref:antimicrobial peptide NK-lysin-like n=1 Tax=Triplophysa dalaica TaxID=1582913 RepID=UPI0024DF40BA|nr:antimicrobial peptide NK-lysin-like [Triplophysa dalaica]